LGGRQSHLESVGAELLQLEQNGEYCPAGRAPCAGGGHFVTYAELRVVLPLVGRIILVCDHREHLREAL
jgi:hypothetical protein